MIARFVRVELVAVVGGLLAADPGEGPRLRSTEPDVYPCHVVAVYLWVNAVKGGYPWSAFREDPRARQQSASPDEVLRWLEELGVGVKVVPMSADYWPPPAPAIALVCDPAAPVGHYLFLRPIADRYVQVADSQGLLAVIPADILRRRWAGQEVWLILPRHWVDEVRPWLGTVLWGAGLGLLVGWAVWRLGGSRWRTGDGTA